MGFTTNEGNVRADRFKHSGKWYDTLEIDMSNHYYDSDLNEAVKQSINEAWPIDNGDMVSRWLETGGYIIVLEPYHQLSYPIMLKEYRGA